MAFEFFRRRQKMVMIIMVILMASFGVGSWGVGQFFGEDQPGERTIATTSAGELLDRDVWAAESDLSVLNNTLGVGNIQRMRMAGFPGDLEYLTLVQTNDRKDIAYALLVQGAEAGGVDALDAEIDTYFSQIGATVGSEDYRTLVSIFKSQHSGSEKNLRGTVGRWLMVHKAYSAAAVDVPPSEPELRRLYRDLNEQIAVMVTHVSADKFLDQVAEPTEEEIQAQFQEFRGLQPGQYVSDTSFGFGYLQPDRLAIAYLLINGEPVQRVTTPSDKEVRDYYRAHRKEFLREQPATDEAATKPAETAPAGEPKEFSEVKDEIVNLLKEQAVSRKLDDLAGQVESLLQAYEKEGVKQPGPYEWVISRMVASGDDALAKPLSGVAIHNQRLDEAMNSLAQAAGLSAICYPFGKTEAGELDPSVRVSFSAGETTLGAALAAISEQVKWPQVQWATCEGFEGVLFPANDEMGLLPVRFKQVELSDYRELMAEEVLVRAATPARQPLLMVAFQADPFAQQREKPGLVKVGEDGPRMVIRGEKPGRLVWRVTDAQPSGEPKELTDKIRLQVVQDVRTKKAFALAVAKAKELLAKAQDDGLAAVSQAEKLDSKTGELFPRMTVGHPFQETFIMELQRGRTQDEAALRAILTPPYDYRWSNVPDAEVADARLRPTLVEAAFSLVPHDIEPAAGDKPYPDKPYALASAEVPSRREVVLMQRADYRPAVAGEFEKAGRNDLLGQMTAVQQWQTRQNWFNLAAIKNRMDFKEPTE